jgi:hypothetical protein
LCILSNRRVSSASSSSPSMSNSSSGKDIKEDITPDFRRETRCISYVCQDLVPHI